MYHLYLLLCSDNTFYTGITTDLARRIDEHNSSGPGAKGAKYTRGRQPVRLVYSKAFPDRSTASVEEARVKRLSREQKHALAL
jgi:putative endonuclease